MEALLAIKRIRLLAGAIAQTTHGPEARLLDHLVVVAVLGVLTGQDVHVALGGHHQVLLCANVRTCHVQVAPGHHDGGVAGEGRALGLLPIGRLDGVRGLRRQEAALFIVKFVVRRTGLHPGRQIDVAAGAHGQLFVGSDISRARIHVLPRDQRQVAACGNRRTDLFAGAQVVAVFLVDDDRLAVAFRQGFQIDVAAGLQPGVALGVDLRGRQVDVATGSHVQVTGIHASHARDVRTPGAAEVLGRRRRGQGNVAPRLQRDGIALDQRGEVGQVGARGQIHGGALDQAAGLVDDVGRAHDGGMARADRAAVVDIAVGDELDVAPGHQGAVALQVVLADQQVDLGHQHRLGTTVGQGDRLRHQPDQIGLELALLRVGQRHAHLHVVGSGELRARGQQCLVLAVVVAKAFQEALAGGGQDLVGYELLLVEAVTQTLGLARWRQEPGARGHQGVPTCQPRA
ncbi:hypothetical protein D3C86_1274070 [compost metagenome]